MSRTPASPVAVVVLVGLGTVTAACPSRTSTPVEAAATQPAAPQPAPAQPVLERRPLPQVGSSSDGFFKGISYGPFREGQAPGGPDPTREQIAEDLAILDPEWEAIRVYSSRGPTEDILEVIASEGHGLKVMLGAWIAPDDPEANAIEVREAIRLANAHPDVVFAVSVGNESQVDWSAHRTDSEILIDAIREVRGNVEQPVTTADDYNFWNKPESHAVADEVDFILLHAYAMWNGKTLEEAVPWTEATVAAIRKEHPGIPIALGETGWATELNPEGEEVKHIKAPAGEAEQKVFYEAFTRWAADAELPYFYFEAFDEPWKGSADPREVEKHWGLYNVDRTPKAALKGSAP